MNERDGGIRTFSDVDDFERRLRDAVVVLNKRRVSGVTLVEAIDEAKVWPESFENLIPFLPGFHLQDLLERAPFLLCSIAAEIGFRFEGVGTEYWHKLAVALGSSITMAERGLFGDAFKRLSDKYAISRPTESAFSSHFSIISWPISNALLPLDLIGPATRLLARAPAGALPAAGRSTNFSSLRAWASAAEGARLVDWLRFEAASERVMLALLTENRNGGISAVSYQRIHEAVTRSSEAFFATRVARQRAKRSRAVGAIHEGPGQLTLVRDALGLKIYVAWPSLPGDLADEAKAIARAAGWRPQLWSSGARLHSDNALGEGPFLLQLQQLPPSDLPAFGDAAMVFGEGSSIAAALAGRTIDWSETLLFDVSEDSTRAEQRFAPFAVTQGLAWIACSSASSSMERLLQVGLVAGYRVFEANLADETERDILLREGMFAAPTKSLAARHPLDSITVCQGVVRPGRPFVVFRPGPPIEVQGLQRLQAGGRFGYPHQLDSVHRMLTGTACRWLLADEVGLGKTVQAIMVMRALAAQSPRPLVAALVVPDDLTEQWEEELLARGHTLALEAGDEGGHQGNLLIRLARPSRIVAGGKIIAEKIDLLMVDEFPKLQVAVRSELLAAARTIPHVLALTATPALHQRRTRGEIMELLEPEAARIARAEGRTIHEVLAEREEAALARFGQELGNPHRRRAVEDSYGLFRRLIRTERSDYPNALPQRRYQPIRVPPTDGDVERAKATRAYLEASKVVGLDYKRDLLLQVAGRSPASLRERLSTLKRVQGVQDAWRQIDTTLRDEPGDAKLDALVDHIRKVLSIKPESRLIVVAEDNPTTDYLYDALSKLVGVKISRKRRAMRAAEELDVQVAILKDALEEFISGESHIDTVTGLKTEFTVEYPPGHPMLQWEGRRLLAAIIKVDPSSAFKVDIGSLLGADDRQASKPEQDARATAYRGIEAALAADRRWLVDRCPPELLASVLVEEDGTYVAIPSAAAGLLDPSHGSMRARQIGRHASLVGELEVVRAREAAQQELRRRGAEMLNRAVVSIANSVESRVFEIEADLEHQVAAAQSELNSAKALDQKLVFNQAAVRGAALALELARVAGASRKAWLGNVAGAISRNIIQPKPRYFWVIPRMKDEEIRAIER